MTLAPVIGAQAKVNVAAGRLQFDYKTPPLATWDPSTAPVSVMPIDSIVVDRQASELDDIEGLTESIRDHGVIEPLIVTPDAHLLAGRRRIAAAKRAGLEVVPVRVRDTADERAAILVGLIVNFERRDPNPMTLAHSYRALFDLGSTVEEIARMVGQDAGHVYQHLALLNLHPDVQSTLCAGGLSFASARLLLPLEPNEQASVLKEILESPKLLSSRQVKAKVEARRVMGMLWKTRGEPSNADDAPSGDYTAIVASSDAKAEDRSDDLGASALDRLNAIIAEMVSAAQGEDDVRRWARRLSRILGDLRDASSTARGIKDAARQQTQLL